MLSCVFDARELLKGKKLLPLKNNDLIREAGRQLGMPR